MKLKGLAVRRLHDLGEFQVDHLAPGLNLLVGPNGSGKTSVMNAARAVLWGTPKLPHAELVTVWDDGRDTWRAALVGGAAGWQRGGVDVPPPEVPDAALAASWVVGLRELLTGGETEQALLERVRRQMAGGYDLTGLLEGYAGKRWPGRAEQKALREQRDALRAIEGRRARSWRGARTAWRPCGSSASRPWRLGTRPSAWGRPWSARGSPPSGSPPSSASRPSRTG